MTPQYNNWIINKSLRVKDKWQIERMDMSAICRDVSCTGQRSVRFLREVSEGQRPRVDVTLSSDNVGAVL
jgi:hypothetical protein